MKTKPLLLLASLLVLTAQSIFGQSPILTVSNVFIGSGGILNLNQTTALVDDSGNFTMAANSQIIFAVEAAMRFAGYSGIDVDGTTSFDPAAMLTLNLINGYSPQDGDNFELFHFFGPVLGTPLFNVPSLDPGLYWNTATFPQTGSVSVTSTPAPEPASAALLGLGVMFLAARRRRAA